MRTNNHHSLSFLKHSQYAPTTAALLHKKQNLLCTYISICHFTSTILAVKDTFDDDKFAKYSILAKQRVYLKLRDMPMGLRAKKVGDLWYTLTILCDSWIRRFYKIHRRREKSNVWRFENVEYSRTSNRRRVAHGRNRLSVEMKIDV